jgi:hypothetical protein
LQNEISTENAVLNGTEIAPISSHRRQTISFKNHVPMYSFVSHLSYKYINLLLIRYFIPEDGDVELQPNVFLAPKSKQQQPPTLEQIKKAFPLAGQYHFRFKAPLVPGTDREKGSMAVWMDCVDDRQCVPTWRSSIIAKVTRIGVEEDEDDDDEDFVRHVSAPSLNENHHSATPSPAASYDLLDPTHTAPPQRQAAAPNLLDGGHSPAIATHKESLLDMNNHHFAPQQATSQSAAHADFFGMSAPPTPLQQPQQPPLNRTMNSTTPPVSGNYNHNMLYGQQQQQQGMYGQAQQQPQAYGQPQQQQRPGQQQVPRPGQNVFDAFSKTNNPGAFGNINDFSL